MMCQCKACGETFFPEDHLNCPECGLLAGAEPSGLPQFMGAHRRDIKWFFLIVFLVYCLVGSLVWWKF